MPVLSLMCIVAGVQFWRHCISRVKMDSVNNMHVKNFVKYPEYRYSKYGTLEIFSWINISTIKYEVAFQEIIQKGNNFKMYFYSSYGHNYFSHSLQNSVTSELLAHWLVFHFELYKPQMDDLLQFCYTFIFRIYIVTEKSITLLGVAIKVIL